MAKRRGAEYTVEENVHKADACIEEIEKLLDDPYEFAEFLFEFQEHLDVTKSYYEEELDIPFEDFENATSMMEEGE